MKTKKRKDLESRWIGRESLKALIGNLNTPDPAFDELRADVERLIDPPPEPSRKGMSASEYRLREILGKIEAMGFSQSRRAIVPLPRPPTGKSHRLRLGNQWFIVGEVPNITPGSKDAKRHVAYWSLDQTLQSGEFSQLKRCRVCSTFFASYRAKAQACKPECHRKYHNTENQRTGKFMKLYYKRKRKNLALAKRLRDRGKDIDYIIDKTELTKLYLVRKKVFDRDEV